MIKRVVLLVTAGCVTVHAWAWGSQIHRAVTEAALASLPPDTPSWLRDPETAARAAFHANQPDRWRGTNSDILSHENDPEHYLDVELLDQFGLSLQTVPRFRMDYLKALAVAKERHPEKVDSYDPVKDRARTHEWPGFVLHAAAEHCVKLRAALEQVRILERLQDPARAMQLAEAREIAVYHLGHLSHFVADMAQPLHTTRHYDGWVGANPEGYKWRDNFHRYIDSGSARTVGLHPERLPPPVVTTQPARAESQPSPAGTEPPPVSTRPAGGTDPWPVLVAHLARSNAELDRLYRLERDGKLDGPAGEELLYQRLTDAVGTLRALILAALADSEPTDEDVAKWVRYD